MATATAQAIIEQAPIDVVAELRSAYLEYQDADRKGLAFGKRLYELRANSEVVQGGTSFASTLEEASIPRRTTYYWIHSYEISIGMREPDVPKKPVQSVRPAGLVIQVPVAPSPITTPQTVTVTIVEPAPTPKIEAGQRIDNLFIHELFDNSAAYDGSRVWLVEDADSGEASLWRTCDLTRIERRGQHVNKCKYGAYDYYDGPITGSQWRMFCQLATERLADIKAGVPLDLGIHKDVLCRINEFDFNKELEAKKGTGWYAERFPTIFSQPVEPQVQEPVEPVETVVQSSTQKDWYNGNKNHEYFCRAGTATARMFEQSSRYFEPIIAMDVPSDPPEFMTAVEGVERLIDTLDVISNKTAEYRARLEQTLMKFAKAIPTPDPTSEVKCRITGCKNMFSPEYIEGRPMTDVIWCEPCRSERGLL